MQEGYQKGKEMDIDYRAMSRSTILFRISLQSSGQDLMCEVLAKIPCDIFLYHVVTEMPTSIYNASKCSVAQL